MLWRLTRCSRNLFMGTTFSKDKIFTMTSSLQIKKACYVELISIVRKRPSTTLARIKKSKMFNLWPGSVLQDLE